MVSSPSRRALAAGADVRQVPQSTERSDRFATFRGRAPEEVRDGTHVYRWAVGAPEFAHRGDVLLRPLPEGLAPGFPHGPLTVLDGDGSAYSVGGILLDRPAARFPELVERPLKLTGPDRAGAFAASARVL
ncbi:hypothetical protein [Streptomyces malaysiensis]|uniref:Uncharacterized protein n=1 Tax=Streptomyces malaysiensis subsp. samsunensis TaxID=459658 RepID=A0A9X2RVF1_STRMQ|nr:hypothetical protein [Streptomyces samsunensis]